jgi:hypothetical protein
MKGARLLPSVCSPESPPGEHRIFEALRDDPGAQGWVVLHSLDLVRHVAKVQGEADFVVIIPEQGVVVLEVKSHSFVKYDERGWWLGNDPQPDPRGPFKQGSQAMHSIREYLNNAGFVTRDVPFISAVAFTGVGFDRKSPEWHPWQVLDLQALNARSVSANLERIIREARRLYASKGLSWAARSSSPAPEACEKMARLLRPRFEYMANPANVLKTLEADLLRCTDQQFRFLDNAADNPRLLVQGYAGTGKTTLAVEALRRERTANPNSRAALFCYNRLLGDKLRSDCGAALTNMKSGSFHQWMVEFTGYKPAHAQAEDSDFWEQQLPDKVLDLLTGAEGTTGILDMLVLDEAQDLFKDAYLDIFDLLLKGGLAGGRWLFFGDFEHQDLFAKRAVPVASFREERASKGCATFRLDINCRNTLEISNTLTLMAKLNPGYSATLRGDSRHDPELAFYDSREAQVELATKAIDDLLQFGFKAGDIILLSPFAKRSIAVDLMNSPRWNGRIAPYPAGRDKISYCTIHSFKGLESPAVILTDFENMDASGRLDLLYVGMSRALHQLYIFAEQSARETLSKAIA